MSLVDIADPLLVHDFVWDYALLYVSLGIDQNTGIVTRRSKCHELGQAYTREILWESLCLSRAVGDCLRRGAKGLFL